MILQRPRGFVERDPAEEIETHRPAIVRELSRQFQALSRDACNDLFQTAALRALAKIRAGETISDLSGYLYENARCDALGLKRHARRSHRSFDGTLDGELADASAPTPEEAVLLSDQARLCREIIESLTDDRQRRIFKLRFDLELSPAQIVAVLGISMRQYERSVDNAAEAIAERVAELRDGSWSRRQRSLLMACLVDFINADGERQTGIATAAQRAEAQRRIASDPAVAAIFAGIVEPSLRRVGALLPAPALAGEQASSARLSEGFVALKQHVADALASGKQQGVALHARVTGLDPHTLPAVRPGAVAGALAGCIAVGSGATYCATQGIPDPLRAPLGIEQAEKTPKEEEAQAKPPAPAPQSPAAAPTPLPKPPAPPKPASQPAAPASPPPAASAPPPQTPAQIQQRNFGIEPQAQAPVPAPSPAPGSGSGGVAQKEFGVP